MGCNSRNLCGRGALGQEILKGTYTRFLPLGDSLNATVGKVANPARKAQFAGCLAGPLPETDSLDTTFDERM